MRTKISQALGFILLVLSVILLKMNGSQAYGLSMFACGFTMFAQPHFFSSKKEIRIALRIFSVLLGLLLLYIGYEWYKDAGPFMEGLLSFFMGIGMLLVPIMPESL